MIQVCAFDFNSSLKRILPIKCTTSSANKGILLTNTLRRHKMQVIFKGSRIVLDLSAASNELRYSRESRRM